MYSDSHIHIKEGYKSLKILDDYLKQARNMNLSSVVFLEHGNRLNSNHIGILSNIENINIYNRTLRYMKEHVNDIKIFTGIEIDYSDNFDFRKQTLELLKYGNFDIVIGSIHFIKFENKEDYYLSILDMINNYDIDIIGHIKLDDNFIDYLDILEDIIKMCHVKDIRIEINTSDRARWNDKQLVYMLGLMKKHNVKYFLGSDAHNELEVGYLIKETIDNIKRLGF